MWINVTRAETDVTGATFVRLLAKLSWVRNATSVSLHLPRQAIWGNIWRHTARKRWQKWGKSSFWEFHSCISLNVLFFFITNVWLLNFLSDVANKNSTSVSWCLLREVIWGYIWRHTAEKNVIFVRQVSWVEMVVSIWLCCSQPNIQSSLNGTVIMREQLIPFDSVNSQVLSLKSPLPMDKKVWRRSAEQIVKLSTSQSQKVQMNEVVEQSVNFNISKTSWFRNTAQTKPL